MLNCLHPVRLLTRTDAEVTTLFHSFFLIEYIKSSDDIKIIERLPKDRPRIDIIEQGLKLFIVESAANSLNSEIGGGFAVTTSDGSRYFAFFRSFDSRIFVAVSSLPSMSFTRNVFELLECETVQSLPTLLLALTEIPVYPGPGLQYDVEFSNNEVASLKFSSVEQVEDPDVDLVVLNLMSPMMLVKAWESIVLERKVLVVSTVESVIAPCCEFLRKMALPLVIVNTFVPLLPQLLINTVEAPFPYLLGANTNMLKDSFVDLSDTVVIDLDTRSVTQPKNKTANPTCGASSNLVAKLVQDINNIILQPLGGWFNRPSSTSSYGKAKRYFGSKQDEFYTSRGSQILQVFVNANLSMVSARNCALKAFFRRPNCISDEVYAEQECVPSKKSLVNMGFDSRNGVFSGYMQLSKGVVVDDDILQHFVPTWIEMDTCIFAVYEYADDLPLIYIPNKDLDSVSPCPVEPEGHVFELVTKDLATYRFTATDTESRRQWINAVEEKMKQIEIQAGGGGAIGVSTPGQAMQTGNDGPSSPFPNGEDCGGAGGSNAITEANATMGLPYPSLEEVDSDSVVREEAMFRFYFMKTQMLTSLLHQVECGEFEPVFKELDLKMVGLVSDVSDFEARVSKYLWKVGTIATIISQISSHARMGSPDSHLSARKSLYAPPRVTYVSTSNKSEPANSSSPAAETGHGAVLVRPSSFSASNCGPGSTEKSKKGFLGGLFQRSSYRHDSSKSDLKDDLAAASLELLREQEAQKQREKVVEDKITQAVRAKVFQVISSYRRCQVELQKAIVESRLEAFGALLKPSIGSGICSVAETIRIPVSQLIKKCTSNQVEDRSVSTVAGESCGRFYDHLWLGLTGKSWESYRLTHVEHVHVAGHIRSDTGDSVNLEEAMNRTALTTTDSDSDGEQLRASNADNAAAHAARVLLAQQQLEAQEVTRNEIRENLRQLFFDLLEGSTERVSPMSEVMKPVLQVLVGCMHEALGDHEEAILSYCSGDLVDYRRVMTCLVQSFSLRLADKDEPFNEFKFISWAHEISPVLGLQAYRLVVEVLYRELLVKLHVDHYTMDKFLALGSFRTFPGSHYNSAGKKDANGLLQKSGTTNSATDFTWVENDGSKSEALNESVTCIMLNSNTTACELSAQLLSRLREILRTYCQSPAGQKQCKKTVAGSLKLKITPAMVEELLNSSAFRAFELQCCQLQKVELTGLPIKHRVMFFCNVYNTITVHALIVKGSPGNNLLERSAFMRSSKYNLGGILYSLLDIEHGILRNSSTKPMIFGPLTISISFGDRDPRKALALEEPWPNVSFCLFSACVSSPALVVLKDPSTVDSEMKRHTRKYFQEHVKIDPVQKSVELPGLMRIYWSDFGGNRSKVLKIISQMSGPQFAADMKPYLADGVKPKVEFATIDWTPMIIL